MAGFLVKFPLLPLQNPGACCQAEERRSTPIALAKKLILPWQEAGMEPAASLCDCCRVSCEVGSTEQVGQPSAMPRGIFVGVVTARQWQLFLVDPGPSTASPQQDVMA